MKMGVAGKEIRLGIIGLGGRGQGQMKTLLSMPDVQVTCVCDLYEDRVQAGIDICREMKGNEPVGTKRYREVLTRDDVDAVVVMTSWTTHLHIATEALRAGKRVAMEVGGAASVDECWQLVRTSEETGIPVMLLENCCYNREEMALLNMVKQGLFGELVHCAGGYQHDLREEIGNGDLARHYRQDNFLNRNGDLYPTHELGPIAKMLNINRGNRMLTLTSTASKARGLSAWLKERRGDSELSKAHVTQGDIVTTVIKCAHGETIVLTHDCTLPRPYSRGLRVQGTKGIYMEDNQSIFLEGKTQPKFDEWLEKNRAELKKNHKGENMDEVIERLRNSAPDWLHEWEKFDDYLKEYEHPLWKVYQEFGLRGGHGGMDYLVLRAFVESVQNQTEPPIDVYDAASWLVITCLSEQSAAMGGAPVAIPDFTDGNWICREAEAPNAYGLSKVFWEKFED